MYVSFNASNLLSQVIHVLMSAGSVCSHAVLVSNTRFLYLSFLGKIYWRFISLILGKEMATHSRILAWEIPWTEEPSGLQFMGSQSWMQLSTYKFNVGFFFQKTIDQPCWFSVMCFLSYFCFLFPFFWFLWFICWCVPSSWEWNI